MARKRHRGGEIGIHEGLNRILIYQLIVTIENLIVVLDIYNMKTTDNQIIEVCKNARSMAAAAAELKIHFNTFKRRAIMLDVYKPNQSGRGISKKHNGNKIELQEILECKHPQYQTGKLRIRLIKAGIKEHECESCGIREWMNNPISLELDHIDGNRTNHSLDNLRILCPNCHSQTSTYRGKNI